MHWAWLLHWALDTGSGHSLKFSSFPLYVSAAAAQPDKFSSSSPRPDVFQSTKFAQSPALLHNSSLTTGSPDTGVGVCPPLDPQKDRLIEENPLAIHKQRERDAIFTFFVVIQR